MVVMNLSSDNRDRLEAQGFEIAELKGFDDHRLPLYTHKETTDKKPGDVVLNARVGNPGSLDDGEATYLARKAFHGLFPWLPGADCMSHQFQDISIPRENGKKVERSEPVMGCKWCRAAVEKEAKPTRLGAAKKSARRAKPKSSARSKTGSKSKAATPTARKAPEDSFTQAD